MGSPLERIIQSSGAFYLQLISIIQSLALGFLLQRVFELASGGSADLSFWLRSLACFAIIILVWHEYAMGSAAYDWLVDLADSSIPFGFAVAEYMLIYYLDPAKTFGPFAQPQAWLLSVVFFTFITTLAYWNQTYKVVKYQRGMEFIEMSRAGVKAGAITFFILSAVFLVWVGDVCGLSTMKNWVVPSIVLFAVFGHVLRLHLGWNKQTSNIAPHSGAPPSGGVQVG